MKLYTEPPPADFRWLSEDRRRNLLDRRADERGADRRNKHMDSLDARTCEAIIKLAELDAERGPETLFETMERLGLATEVDTAVVLMNKCGLMAGSATAQALVMGENLADGARLASCKLLLCGVELAKELENDAS